MTDKEIELALETIALVLEDLKKTQEKQQAAITAIKGALADHAMRETQRLGQEIEQEPVTWLLTDKNINSLQVDSIQRLISRLKYAHHTDLRVRINGQDEWFEADWLKHMARVAPPQRTWVGLTKNERLELYRQFENCLESDDCEYEKAIETKLKEKNT